MKALLSAVIVLASFSAQAFEIDFARKSVPARVREAITLKFEQECGDFTRSVKVLKLSDMDSKRVRIDQGFVEEHYTMGFTIVTKKVNKTFPDRLFIKVVNQVEDRSGRLEAEVTDFITLAGNTMDKICRQ